MTYTLRRHLNGLSYATIKEIYDNNPSLTLQELSNLTGYTVKFLKTILMEQTNEDEY
jgi:hypothetical protein